MALARKHVGARDVVPTITELHFDCLSPGSSGEQLVAQTDTKDGGPSFSHGRFDMLDGVLHHGWVSRAVGDEQTVVFTACELGEIVIPGYDLDFDTSSDEASQLVIFQADVDAKNTNRAPRGMLEGCGWVGRVDGGLGDGYWGK